MSANNISKLKVDALVLSLNDIVVDVNASYHEVVRQTVQMYLEVALGVKPGSDLLVTPEEVSFLQKVGYITNYWDLAKAFITYFVEFFPPVPIVTFPIKFHVPAMLAFLQTASARLNVSMNELQERKNIRQLAYQVAAAGGGIDGASAALPGSNRHLVVASGEITQINLIGRIFQELYLGGTLFEQIYEQPAVMSQGHGYIGRETLLIDRAILAELNRKLPLGLVSMCPKREVNQILHSLSLEPYFQTVITRDEIKEAKEKELPHPWSLLETSRQLYPSPNQLAYVGANPVDMQAANAANRTAPFTGIACLAGASDRIAIRDEFEHSKAHMILGHPDNLKELILE